MRSGLVPRQNVRRHVFRLDQPTLATEAPAGTLSFSAGEAYPKADSASDRLLTGINFRT